MDYVRFGFDYAIALWNEWFGLAAGLLTVNDLLGRFTAFSIEWPRQHRLRAAVAVLLVAQIGAYKSVRDELDVANAKASHENTAAEIKRVAQEAEIEDMQSRLADRDRESEALRDTLLRREPIIVPPPAINLFSGGGPLPTYPLCQASSSNTYWEFPEWKSPDGCGEVVVPWDEMGDVDASAELNVSGMPQDDPRSPGWIQIRLWNVTEGVVAIEGRRRDTMNPETMTLTIPRSNRRTNYRVELRTQPGTSGNVFGAITLARRR